MKETEVFQVEQQRKESKRVARRRRCCCVACSSFLLLLLTFLIIILILAFTIFKPKDPKTEVISTNITGIAPRVSFPAIKIELNITLDLEILVHNPNHASFKHDQGKSLVFYKGGNQIGDVDVFPGNTPARGSEIVKCKLTIEADKFGSDMSGLVRDILKGEIELETKTRIPGRVKLLGFIKRHAVAFSNCNLVIGISDLKVRKQECRNKTKL